MEINNLILEMNSVCNNNCVYCYIPQIDKLSVQDIEKSSVYFKNILHKYKKTNVKNVDFTGGEPTLFPKLFELIKYANDLEFENLTLVTNARILSYQSIVEKYANAGINRVVLTIDGPNEEITEKVTQVEEAFSQVMKACDNIKEKKMTLGVTIVITKLNYRFLSQMFQLCKDKQADFLNIQYLLPFIQDNNINCKTYEKSIIPTYDEVFPFVKDAINSFQESMDISVHFVPFCHLPGYEKYIEKESIKEDRVIAYHKGFEYNLQEHLLKGSLKSKKCKKCKWEERCIGFFPSYSKEFGIEQDLKNG